MGKVNFTAYNAKISELEKQIRELKEANTVLQNTVDKMCKTANTKSLYRRIQPEKMEKVFAECVDAGNGSFIFDNSSENLNQTFSVFSQTVIRRLLPYAYYDKKADRFYIKNTPIKDMSDEQFEIIAETLEAVIDTMCYAKDKLNGISK